MENRWWEEGDGNVRWLNRYAQPLSTDEWQNGPKQLQILLSDRFLIAINATLEVTEIVLPAGEWHAIPPFAGCLLIRSPDQETSSPGNPQPYPEV